MIDIHLQRITFDRRTMDGEVRAGNGNRAGR